MKRRNFFKTAVATGATLKTLETTATIKPTSPFIVKAGKPRFDDGIISGLKVSSKDTNGEFSMFEENSVKGPKSGPPLHIHHGQDETFHIIEGEYLFQVGNEKIKASAGDTLFGPRGVPHTYYQLSEKAHMIFTYNPAGNMENIFEWMNKNKPFKPEDFAKFCKENKVEFVGPPMSKPE